MSQTIKLKRSAVAGKVPTTGSLDLGELAVNTSDGKVYLKKDNGIQSIQTLVTTDSSTSGSLNLIGNQSITGSLFISGDVVVTGGVTGSFEGVHTVGGVDVLDTALAYAIALG